MTRRERRRLVISMAASVGIAALLSFFLWSGLFVKLENQLEDVFFQTWTPRGVADGARSVVIVAIDDASVAKLGRLGDWPRRYYARVIDRIREGYARDIAFDVGFPDPNEDDGLVADALQRFLDVTPEEMQAAGAPLSRHAVIFPILGTPSSSLVKRAGAPDTYPSILEPVDGVARISLLGHGNVIPDPIDGYVRSTPLLVQAGDQRFPSLSLAAAAAYTSTGARGYVLDPDALGVRALNRFVPTDDNYEMTISFSGPPSHVNDPQRQTFKTVSFLDLLNGQIDPAIFRDKMVFLGTLDATGFADDYQVPTSSRAGKMAGVEIHAQAFTTLLAAEFFTQQQYPVTVAWIWLLCLVTGFLTFRLSILPCAVITLVLGAGYELGSFKYADYYYDASGVAIPNLVYPLLALVITLLVGVIWRVAFEHAEVRATRGAMGKYLSPAILKAVLDDPDRLHLGGEKRVLTVLFTDIRDFTSISEKLEPETLVDLLTEYLTVMTEIVHRWDGVLDKYMGDAIMAWWGAPLPQGDHAYRACMTAIEMRAALYKLHEGWVARDVPPLEMGVGINTGPVVYGNMGSRDLFDFTVLGDDVNLASRLEGANKEYKSNVIISSSTRQQVIDRGFVTRYLDVIEVKGKTEPVEIYELLGVAGEAQPDLPDLIAAWETAVELYRAREFGLAEDAFRRVLAVRPDDGPARVYAERCADLRANPPAPDWDGVFVMTHK